VDHEISPKKIIFLSFLSRITSMEKRISNTLQISLWKADKRYKKLIRVTISLRVEAIRILKLSNQS